MSEWRPIQTAPKDGSKILGFMDGRMAVVQFDRQILNEWELSEPGNGYLEDANWSPTHWMPLPTPPE